MNTEKAKMKTITTWWENSAICVGPKTPLNGNSTPRVVIICALAVTTSRDNRLSKYVFSALNPVLHPTGTGILVQAIPGVKNAIVNHEYIEHSNVVTLNVQNAILFDQVGGLNTLSPLCHGAIDAIKSIDASKKSKRYAVYVLAKIVPRGMRTL